MERYVSHERKSSNEKHETDANQNKCCQIMQCSSTRNVRFVLFEWY